MSTYKCFDDILVYGGDAAEHESRLQATLKRIQSAGITLNEGKCQFYQPCVTFLINVFDANRISPDPRKIAAIKEMIQPSSVMELRRFMVMVNQMCKFSPKVTRISKPLRELLNSKAEWIWTAIHSDAFH